jgi:hypothetical protein
MTKWLLDFYMGIPCAGKRHVNLREKFFLRFAKQALVFFPSFCMLQLKMTHVAIRTESREMLDLYSPSPLVSD